METSRWNKLKVETFYFQVFFNYSVDTFFSHSFCRDQMPKRASIKVFIRNPEEPVFQIQSAISIKLSDLWFTNSACKCRLKNVTPLASPTQMQHTRRPGQSKKLRIPKTCTCQLLFFSLLICYLYFNSIAAHYLSNRSRWSASFLLDLYHCSKPVLVGKLLITVKQAMLYIKLCQIAKWLVSGFSVSRIYNTQFRTKKITNLWT